MLCSMVTEYFMYSLLNCNCLIVLVLKFHYEFCEHLKIRTSTTAYWNENCWKKNHFMVEFILKSEYFANICSNSLSQGRLWVGGVHRGVQLDIWRFHFNGNICKRLPNYYEAKWLTDSLHGAIALGDEVITESCDVAE